MTDEKYALVTDIGTQWFTYVVKYSEDTELTIIIDACKITPRVMNTPFCMNVCDKHPDLNGNWEMTIGPVKGFYGHSLSLKDYERIREMTVLVVLVDLFEAMAAYP